MSNRKILALNGHPGQTSLLKPLCQAYRDAAKENGHTIRHHDLGQMSFDPDYGEGGYRNAKPLEPDLKSFVSDLEWADHIVMSTPLW